MNSINRNTQIHVVGIAPDGTRNYLVKAETARNARGELVLCLTWSREVKASKSMSYGFAVSLRARFFRENRVQVHFTLQAGSREFVDDNSLSVQTEDYSKRVPMSYRGLQTVPGFDTRNQTPCWFVRFPDTNIESLRGATVEEAVDKVYERPDLLPHAERAPEQVEEKEEPRKPAGHRIRPGDLR